MGLPDYFKIGLGSPIIWGESGASGVTDVLSLNGLASGSGRMGDYVDLGETFEEEFLVYLLIESGTAPTAGLTIELYLPSTDDPSRWPGGVSGSDGAWPADGNEDEWAKQLGIPAAVLVATGDGNTIQVQAPELWLPSGRYVAPVVDNNWDQAVRSEGTATDNDSRVILVPRQRILQDAA